jgi:hypothetical protein
MEVCSKSAIQYSLLGVPLRGNPASTPERSRFLGEVFRPDTLFVMGAILFGGTLSGSMVAGALLRLLHLAQTGSMLYK